MRRTAVYLGLAVLCITAVVFTSAADSPSSDEEDDEINLGDLSFQKGECPGYGFMGACWQLCDWVTGKEVNAIDNTVTFVVTLVEFNITSSDSMYVTCDPISGDISDYTTALVLTNIQDIPGWEISDKAPSAVQSYITNCTDYLDAEACAPLCDYIVDRIDESDKYKTFERLSSSQQLEKLRQKSKDDEEDQMGFKLYLKWQFQIFSENTDFVACIPDTGEIVDFDDWTKQYTTVRQLVRDFAGFLDDAMPTRSYLPGP